MTRNVPALAPVLTAAALAAPASAETVALNGSTLDGLADGPVASLRVGAVGTTLTLSAGVEGGQMLAATGLGGDPGSVGVVSDAARNPNLQPGDELILTPDAPIELRGMNLAGVGEDTTDSATISVGDLRFTVYGDETVEPATEGVTYSTRDDRIEFAAGVARLGPGETLTLSNDSTGNSAYALTAVTLEAAGEAAEAPAEPG